MNSVRPHNSSDEGTPVGSPRMMDVMPYGDGSDSPAADATQRKERIEFLEQKIAQNSYDSDAWQSLLTEVQNDGEVEKARDVFERMLKVFPTSAKTWINYAEFELKFQNLSQVEAIFQRCLRHVLSVDLWKHYLNYIRRVNTGPDARNVIQMAYEFVLNHVGLDRNAGPIWSDYLFFLKSGVASNTWEEQTKMDKMRRTFQRAVCIPLTNIEHIWRDYDQFENGLNKLTAKKFLGERSPAYMTARVALRELKFLTDGLNKHPFPRPVKWTEREIHQLELWKRYVAWEKTNPLHFDDKAQLTARVQWAYKQALMAMRFYPEIWYEAAMYFHETSEAAGGKVDEAVALLKNACEIMPTSYLVHFAYAELEESRKNTAEAREAYESLIKNLSEKIDEMNKKVDEDVQRMTTQLMEEHQQEHEAAGQANKKIRDAEEVNGEMRERERDEFKKRTKEIQEFEKNARKEVDKVVRGAGLAWIMFMQYVRRTEGTNQWRKVFGRARRSNGCPYEVYVAAALLEYHCTKDSSVAGKVFEIGYKSFSDEPRYVLHYLEYLIQLNDDSNTRALFERALIGMSPDKARPLWEMFSEYENKFGDLTAIMKVEKRRREVYPEDSAIERFAERYSFDRLKIIDEADLGASIRKNLNVPAASDFSTEFPPPPEVDLDRAAIPGRRPLLEPVHPDVYPRPDFGQWTAHKFNPEMLLRKPGPVPTGPGGPKPMNMDTPPMSGAVPMMGDGGMDQAGLGPGPGPAGMTNGPPLPAPFGAAGNRPHPPPSGPPVPPMGQRPQGLMSGALPPGMVVPGWTAGPHGLIPEAVAFFLSNLPPPNTFNGPSVKAEDILELIQQAQIPAGQGMVVPPPVPVPASAAGAAGGPPGGGMPSSGSGGPPPPPPPMPPVPPSGAGGQPPGGFGRDRDMMRDGPRDPRDPRQRPPGPPLPPPGGGPGGPPPPLAGVGGYKPRGGGRGGGMMDRGGPGGGRGGGGGPGGPGLKRKGREHEDDMHHHHGGPPGAGGGGPGYRGGPMPGVNRPPEYDPFRARQQKKAHMDS
ncbi:mRNA 3'-end-processing protein rna14 [Actinomortierella ambigua]|nr:mRNA 3'-end-processing protein rna14 [Actinomortierella ambigua]